MLGEQEGEFKLVVNPKSLLYLFGLQLDYRWVGFAVGPFLFSSQVGSIVGPHLLAKALPSGKCCCKSKLNLEPQ